LTLINIGSMIGSILGIVELYLKHKMWYWKSIITGSRAVLSFIPYPIISP
jgi:hypothetical protein